MGLFDRIGRLIRANLNQLISQAEDPEKILEQTIMDMQDDLIQMRQGVAQAIATQKRTERQCKQSQSSAEEWKRRAQIALEKGEEDLARDALTRRKSYQTTAITLDQQINQQRTIVEKLKQDMRTLEAKISEAKTKKDMYIARARSAQASQRMNEMLGRFNSTGALSAFERMEEKVMDLEARSQAVAELNTDAEQNSLEGRFAALESGDVEAELDAMKAELQGSSDPAQLPSSSNNPASESSS